MDQICLVVPITPGKTGDAREFMRELEENRKPDYNRSERRLGITKEAWYLTRTPGGDQFVAYMESPDFGQALSLGMRPGPATSSPRSCPSRSGYWGPSTRSPWPPAPASPTGPSGRAASLGRGELAPAYLSDRHAVRQAADLIAESGSFCGQERWFVHVVRSAPDVSAPLGVKPLNGYLGHAGEG